MYFNLKAKMTVTNLKKFSSLEGTTWKIEQIIFKTCDFWGNYLTLPESYRFKNNSTQELYLVVNDLHWKKFLLSLCRIGLHTMYVKVTENCTVYIYGIYILGDLSFTKLQSGEHYTSLLFLENITYTVNNVFLKGVWHEIFDLQFFSWLEPIWAPDKQAKVFSNSVSISPRY